MKKETTFELIERVASWPLRDRVTALRNELVILMSRQTVPHDEDAIEAVKAELTKLGAMGK